MILLVINEKRTELEGRIICEAFLGVFSITKTGYVSGKPLKILQENEELDAVIGRIAGKRLDMGVVALDNKSFEKAISLENLFVGYNNNRKIVEITSNTRIKLKNVSVEKNKLFITNEKHVLRVDEKWRVIAYDKYTVFIYKNHMWVLDESLDKRVLKQVIFSKRPKSEISRGELFLKNRESVKYEICEDIKIIVNLTMRDGQCYVEPVVLYNGMKPQKIDEETVCIEGVDYYRDLLSEKRIKRFFGKYEMVAPDIYTIPCIVLYKAIRNMIEEGIEVYYEKKRAYVEEGSFKNIHIKKSIDWFEIDGNIEFDDESIEVSELIGMNTPFYATDNKVLVVPDNITRMLEMADSQAHIEKTPENFVELLEISEANFNKNSLSELFCDDLPLKVADKLIETLYDYQFDGVLWLKSLAMKGYGGCLADDMGLGKTLQIIAFLSDEDIMTKYNKVIIIVPRTLLGNWVSEFEKYNICERKVSIYYGANREIDLSANVYITTYGVLTSDYEILMKYEFDMVILDEAQKVKNVSSKTRIVVKKFSRGKVLYATTGTPYENNLMELWSIMDLTNPNMLGSLKVFSDKYVLGNDEEKVIKLSERISPFLLRRTKAEVLKQLPKKMHENIVCLMEEKQQRLYNAMLIKIKKDIKSVKEHGMQKIQMLNGLTYLREICCHPKLINDIKFQKCDESIKLDVVMELVDKTIQRGEKIVVFSQFTRFLRIIENALIEKNIKYSYIDGQTSDRDAEIEKFCDKERHVFLISLKAGGFGINLTNAQNMIICDPWWNPAVERQAEDRIYRIGQQENVTVYRLITKSTVEEKIQLLKEQKDDLGNLIYEGLKDISELEMKKIQSLFE